VTLTTPSLGMAVIHSFVLPNYNPAPNIKSIASPIPKIGITTLVANSIFAKVGRLTSEKVIVQSLKQKFAWVVVCIRSV